MIATFDLRTLGTAELRGPDGRSVRSLLAQPKRFALLAYLAIAQPRGFHRRDKLLALFWPDADTEHARTSLRKAVHVIRRALTEDSILARGDEELGIHPERLRVDVAAFESLGSEGRLAEALDYYRGDLLPAFFIQGAHGFEEWLDLERGRLRQRAAELARTLAEEYEGKQQLTLAVSFARRAFELSSSDERAVRRLIELLDGLGDRAGAVHAYEEFARRLAVDLEIEPSAETRALVERVRNRLEARLRSTIGRRQSPAGDVDRSSTSMASRSPRVADPSRLEPAVADRAAPEHSSYTPHPVGTLLDIPGYIIERELAQGGMAVVYLARDVKRGRRVAIKVLRSDLALGPGIERFFREIEIMASFAHPHILPLLDSGTVAGIPYFVMPYVAGESLRGRLERERRLDVAPALEIVRQVADALHCAHARGVVHRDIKPENILFAEGHAVVADFGIARAAEYSGAVRVTATGVAFGSPAYMSPEQARGERDVDARSDIYSLGCVLFEMLSGRPPFDGASPNELLIKHQVEPPPRLRAVRPDAPRFVTDAVATALAKEPNDRFQSAHEFMDALVGRRQARSLGRSIRFAGRDRRLQAAVAGGALFLAGAWMADRVAGLPKLPEPRRLTASSTLALPPARYAIFEVDSSAAVVRHSDYTQLIHDALGRWEGLGIVPQLEAERRVESHGIRGARARDLRDLASALGASRYVRVHLAPTGDSMRMRMALFETATDSLLREVSARVAKDLSGAGQIVAASTTRLLVGEHALAERVIATLGTRSFPALESYLRGQSAIGVWDLSTADTAFFQATLHDPAFAEALLWLAQVRFWRRDNPARWISAADRAGARREQLVTNDALLGDALLAFAKGDVGRACAHFVTLTERVQHDFAAWYGLAECLRRDGAVLRDPQNASAWRFRTSYWQAVNAYRRAYQLLPSVHRSFVVNSFTDVREMLFTSSAQTRRGRALAPDTVQFRAYPTWQGDSLAFVPLPADSASMWTLPAAVNLAIKRQRAQFADIATMWRAAFPESPEALEAVALSLEMLGDPSAIDTLREARRRAKDSEDLARIAATEVWMLVKRSLPSDLPGLRRAQRLADSLLRMRAPQTPTEARLLASLAALTGRAYRAATLAQRQYAHSAPAGIATTGPALLAFAALGGPADSLRALQPRLVKEIEATLAGNEQEGARRSWLMRAATLAYPEHVFDILRSSDTDRDYLVSLLRASLARDGAAVRQQFSSLAAARAAIQPSDLMIDGLYPEAAALASLQRNHEAIAWLDPTLESIALAVSVDVADVARAGSLVRAMALRADLADRVGDRAAARTWAAAVLVLWYGADDFLDPLLKRMRQLAR
jgi:DNA-binding SARP family transcriptional activator